MDGLFWPRMTKITALAAGKRAMTRLVATMANSPKKPWLCYLALMCCVTMAGLAQPAPAADVSFPPWAYEMKVWPLDPLYPDTTLEDITANLDLALSRGANTVFFSIEEEQMYRTFVDEAGFAAMLQKIASLITAAHARKLRAMCYLNSLEVMAHNACKQPATPTLARTHPEWLQKDIYGQPLVWTCIQNGWITPDMEDAWASPYSGFRDLFKRRLQALGDKGLDAVYLDQASLPGMWDYGSHWASSDPGFAAAFQSRYGLTVPKAVDWTAVSWRKFLYFRHQAIQDYLADLAATARTRGIVPFFESSANDTRDGTELGNEPALSVMAGIGCAPEIEPEGDYGAGFRMAKFARDIRPAQPILYTGWPETAAAARQEFAVALSQSGNFYATADCPHPAGAFAWMDQLRAPVLNRRVPYQEIGLIYSARNKDWTYPNDQQFNLYVSAFNQLAQRHLPFKIIPLETLTTAALQGVGALVLPGVASITDGEFALLASHPVVLMGENGTRDEWFEPRAAPLHFPRVVTMGSLSAHLPFTLTAPPTTLVEYYTDRADPSHFFIFAFSTVLGGNLQVQSRPALEARIYELGKPTRTMSGAAITVTLKDYLLIMDLRRIYNPAPLELLLSGSRLIESFQPRRF